MLGHYAITLKDRSGNIIEKKEKMDSHCQVPNSDSEPTTSGNAHLDKVATSLEANPSSNTKIKKKTINEAQLRAIISEAVKGIPGECVEMSLSKEVYSILADEATVYSKLTRDLGNVF